MKKLPWIALGMALMAVPTALAASVKFSDLKESDWYYPAVQHLQELEIVKGYEDQTYRGDNAVNRAEMAVMMDRLASKVENGCIFLTDEHDHGPEVNRFFLDGELVYNFSNGAEIATCKAGYIEVVVAN